MNFNFNKKSIWAIIGIITCITYLTYYFIKPFGFLNFVLGFGAIYLIFVVPVRYIWKSSDSK